MPFVRILCDSEQKKVSELSWKRTGKLIYYSSWRHTVKEWDGLAKEGNICRTFLSQKIRNEAENLREIPPSMDRICVRRTTAPCNFTDVWHPNRILNKAEKTTGTEKKTFSLLQNSACHSLVHLPNWIFSLSLPFFRKINFSLREGEIMAYKYLTWYTLSMVFQFLCCTGRKIMRRRVGWNRMSAFFGWILCSKIWTVKIL